MFGGIGFMRDQNYRVSVIVKFLQNFHHLHSGFGIQISGRLIGKNYFRIITKARAIATRCFSPPDSWLENNWRDDP